MKAHPALSCMMLVYGGGAGGLARCVLAPWCCRGGQAHLLAVRTTHVYLERPLRVLWESSSANKQCNKSLRSTLNVYKSRFMQDGVFRPPLTYSLCVLFVFFIFGSSLFFCVVALKVCVGVYVL